MQTKEINALQFNKTSYKDTEKSEWNARQK